MKAHNNHQAAVWVKNAQTAARAKTAYERAIPTYATERAWYDTAANEMICINKLKAQHYATFRDAFVGTGTAHLVHNMESDELWGFGRNVLV